MGNAKYRMVGDHAESLASGQMLEPGEFATLSDDDADEEHNKELMARGVLIGTGEKSEEEVESAQKAAARLAKKQAKEEEGG